MELLGNKDAAKDILNIISDINSNLLSCTTLSDDTIKKTVYALTHILDDSSDASICYHEEIISLLFLLKKNKHALEIPMIKNLAEELELKMIRVQCLNTNYSNCSPIPAERERFLPTPDNNFVLPPNGQITNLTITEPKPDIGKTLIRDVMIDSKGYIVEEKTRRYEDFYTDETEQIYNDAYISELKNINKNKNKDTETIDE